MDIKKAYEVIGLPDGAGFEEVQRKYDVLLKQRRAVKLSGEFGEKDQERFDEIDKAYSTIVRALEGGNVESGASAGSAGKKTGGIFKRISSVFYYYKMHVFFAVLIVVVIALLSRGAFSDKTADVNIILLGDIALDDTSKLEERITGRIPGVDNPVIQKLYVSEFSTAQAEVMERAKAATLIASGEADVFILDKKMFFSLASEGVFMSLDSLAEELGIDREANKDYIVELKNNGEQRFCGIDATDSSFLKDIGLEGDEFIIAMRPTQEHYAISVSIVKMILGL